MKKNIIETQDMTSMQRYAMLDEILKTGAQGLLQMALEAERPFRERHSTQVCPEKP